MERGYGRAAYTSFDGDFISSVARMCLASLMLDVVPLNPEAALGYYVSTTSLGNVKAAVMEACLAVQFKADELWIVTGNSPSALRELPEGVLAEYVLWRELRPDAPVRHFRWLGPDWQQYLTSDARSAAEVMHDGLLSDQQHEELVQSITAEFRSDLEARLLRKVRETGFMPVVFLSTVEIDDKHLDWARRAAYNSGLVPFSPSTLLPALALDLVGLDDEQRRSLRNILISRADEFWVVVKPHELKPGKLPEIVLEDIRTWEEVRPGEAPHLLSWADVDVPKYSGTPWSLTDKERQGIS